MTEYAIVNRQSFRIPPDHVTLPIHSAYASPETAARAFAGVMAEAVRHMDERGFGCIELPFVIAVDNGERRQMTDTEEDRYRRAREEDAR